MFSLKIRHIFLLGLFSSVSINAIVPTRVILATDDNPKYIQFWPVVALAWKEIVGVQPTLAVIADHTVDVDTTLGDVIYFDPIPGVSTALYAQCIRLLLPVLYEDEVCLVSDMDMIPLQKEYFIDSVFQAPDDNMVVYRYNTILKHHQIPMCYIAAKGKVYGEIFGVTSMMNIPKKIKEWSDLRLGWTTDQHMLYYSIKGWPKFATHCTKLNLSVKRIDRAHWPKYDAEKLAKGYYTDCHCPRPYANYKHDIDKILTIAIARRVLN